MLVGEWLNSFSVKVNRDNLLQFDKLSLCHENYMKIHKNTCITPTAYLQHKAFVTTTTVTHMAIAGDIFVGYTEFCFHNNIVPINVRNH